MKNLKILSAIALISLLFSCSLWENRKQIAELALHGSKPESPIMLVPVVQQEPSIPKEKSLTDVLKAFTERDRKFIITCQCDEDDMIRYVFFGGKSQEYATGGRTQEYYEFKKDLRKYTLVWNIYKVIDGKGILQATYPLNFESFNDYRVRSLRANGVIIYGD